MSASTTGSLAKHCALQQSSPETSRSCYPGRRPTLMQQGGAVTWAQPRSATYSIFSSGTLASSSTPDAIVQRQSADIKRGSSQTFFYSRQCVTPIVDKTDKFASGINPLNRRFLRGPVIKDSSLRHRFCSGAWFYGTPLRLHLLGFVDIKARIHFRVL